MKKMCYLSLTWILSISYTWANCPDVSGLQATPLSDTEVVLSWNELPDATHYQLKVELEEGAAPFEFWLSLNNNTYTLGNLNPNGVYKFKVRTVCGDEKASWSENQFFSTSGIGNTGGVCAIPSQLQASLDLSGTAILSWEAVPGALLYEVEVESEEATPFFVQEFLTTENLVEITGLEPNGTYKFKVKSKCGGSNSSDYSAWSLFPQGSGNGGGNTGTCDTPPGLTVFNISTNGAWISWEAVPGAEGYEVQVEDDEDTPAFDWEVVTASNEVEVTGLAPGGNYQVKVKTKCSGGNNSENTEWVFFSTNTSNFNGNGPQNSFMSTPTQSGSLPISLQLSPNPVVSGEMLQLRLENVPSTEEVQVLVYDLQGHLFRTIEVSALHLESLQIPTLGLRPGMYQLIVRSNDNIHSSRFSLLD